MQAKYFIGVKFPQTPDTFYAEVKQVFPDGSFECRFVHTGSTYVFRYKSGQLEVIKSTGLFKPGTVTSEANFFEPTDKWTQYPGGFASVTFKDGISYLGIVESYNPELKIKFLHSGNIYTFNNQGIASSGNGAYNGQGTLAIRPYTMLFTSTTGSAAASPASVTSDTDTAIFHINNFRNHQTSAWNFLDRNKVADRLIALVKNPDSIMQANLSLCGPAAFITIYAKYNPIDFALFAIGLFDEGMASMNTLLFEPPEDLRNANYGAISKADPQTPDMADWMILSTLANANNYVVDYEGTPGEGFAGFTYPKRLKLWLENIGRFSSVENNTNLINRMSYKEIINKSATGSPIILLINHSMLYKEQTKGFPPDHYIVLKSPISLNGSDLEFDYWSWGKTERLKIWSLDFDNSFFGYVMATA